MSPASCKTRCKASVNKGSSSTGLRAAHTRNPDPRSIAQDVYECEYQKSKPETLNPEPETLPTRYSDCSREEKGPQKKKEPETLHLKPEVLAGRGPRETPEGQGCPGLSATMQLLLFCICVDVYNYIKNMYIYMCMYVLSIDVCIYVLCIFTTIVTFAIICVEEYLQFF